MRNLKYKFFYTPSKYAVSHLIYSDGMGTSCDENFLIRRDYFDNYVVMMVVYGCLVFEQNNCKYEVFSGSSVITDLRFPHRYYFKKNVPSKIIWYHFNGMTADFFMQKLHEQMDFPLIIEKKEIQNDILELFSITREHSADMEAKISVHIYSCLVKLSEQLLKSRDNSYDFKQVLTDYIRTNLTGNLSIKKMSELMCMSRSTFFLKFKQAFQTTPNDYITNEKINLAKRMLSYSQESICDISTYLNFSDQSYFTNSFKKITGLTPGEYRASHTIAANLLP